MAKARRLPRDPGISGWYGILENVMAFPELGEDITADVAIIGAGFTGLSAARRLAMHGGAGRIVVLDATRIGTGPAGRNSGFMIDLPHAIAGDSYVEHVERDRNLIAMNRRAQAFAADVAAEYELPEHCVDPCGKINAYVDAAGAHHNDAYAKVLDTLGEKYTLLSKEDMAEITGSGFYAGGMMLPGTVLIQPAEYITGLAMGLHRNAGNHLAIYENTPALSYEKTGSAWRIKTPKGNINAGKIILGINGHLESFGYYTRRLLHVFTYGSMTRAMTAEEASSIGGHERWGITPSDPMGTSIRRITSPQGPRIVIRNRWSYDPSMEVSDARIRTYASDHVKALHRRYAHLRHVEMEYEWGGRLCLSRNDAPAFGEVEDGVIAACCQNALGTTQGTQAGIAAADYAMGEDTEFTRFFATRPKPEILPPAPITYAGAKAVIALREFRARKEL